jgi:SAM-dependent methyltransferase
MSATLTLKVIQKLGLTSHAKRLKKFMVRSKLWPKGGFGYSHRKQAYKLLSGRGLEVGALHCPANLPSRCKVEYCDAHSKEEAAKLFPEIESALLVDVDYIVNLDEDRLSEKVKPLYDFVIMNHVIEHVANPMSVLAQLFAVTRVGGYVVISAPDKEYTFDKPRQLTPFEHLLWEYEQKTDFVDDSHYLDFIRHTAPDIFNSGDKELLATTLASIRERREHAHVWDTESFLDFLKKSADYLKIKADIKFVSKAASNNIECFVLLKKVKI